MDLVQHNNLNSAKPDVCNFCKRKICMNESYTDDYYTYDIEKCSHCDFNSQCKILRFEYKEKKQDNFNKDSLENINGEIDFDKIINHHQYKKLKREFKQKYSSAKDIIKKINNLKDTLEVDENTLNELNAIKYQINSKASDLINRIEDETNNLNTKINQITSIYEKSLSKKKNYISSTHVVKEELKHLTKKYKQIKSSSSVLTLKELDEMFLAAKCIREKLDYVNVNDEIFINEIPELSFEESPAYRSYIGKLHFNKHFFEGENAQKSPKVVDKKTSSKNQAKKRLSSQSIDKLAKDPIIKKNENDQITKKNIRDQKLEISRTLSLEDLIEEANNLISNEQPLCTKTNISKQLQNLMENYKKEIISNSNITYPMLNQENYLSSDILKQESKYRAKREPLRRLNLDIIPTHLAYYKNRLLIASSDAKIRIFDLDTNKIQKDSIKNVLISSACIIPFDLDNNNELSFVLTNGEISGVEDPLNVSNSVIVVTKSQLKVLKHGNENISDQYKFLNPCGTCYDNFNNLYVCDTGYNRVKIFDKNFALLYVIDKASNDDDKLNQPNSVSFCQTKSMLYISDSGNHRIVCFQIADDGKNFKFSGAFGMGFGESIGQMKFAKECCSDNMGFVCLRDHHNNRVNIYNSNAQPIHSIELNQQNEHIYSLAMSENGQIFVGKMVYKNNYDFKSGQYLNGYKYFIDIY